MVIRGPYWTGAVTPSGAVAPVVAPQPHRRATNWCSMTRTAIGGRRTPARRSPAASVHPAGRCRTRRSVAARAAPPRPGQRPWTASTPDALAAHPVCVRSCAATTSAQAWRTESRSTAASTNSTNPDPAGGAVPRPQPEDLAPSPAGPRSPPAARRFQPRAPRRPASMSWGWWARRLSAQVTPWSVMCRVPLSSRKWRQMVSGVAVS